MNGQRPAIYYYKPLDSPRHARCISRGAAAVRIHSPLFVFFIFSFAAPFGNPAVIVFSGQFYHICLNLGWGLQLVLFGVGDRVKRMIFP